ncbi:MAG: hypothetical protein K9N55_10220 [Phycisphaerae bacterium]|nr:hypothetical protein [Phycisphaerae bacterium]
MKTKPSNSAAGCRIDLNQPKPHASGQAGLNEEARFVSPGQRSTRKVRQDRPAGKRVSVGRTFA